MAGPDTSAFTTVKEQVDLEDYLTEHLGVDLVPSGAGRTAALCPFHAEDTPSFYVEETGDGWKRWHCYGACQEGGTVIDAAMKAEGFELAKEAIVYLNDLYGLELDINMRAFREFAQAVAETENEIRRTREEIESGNDKAKIAEQYLLNRGLSKEAVEFFQLGLDTQQTKSGRISIPLIDKANHPVSIANRALFDSFDCRACGHEVIVKEMVKQRHDAMRAKERGEGDGNYKYCPHCHAPDREAKVAWLVTQNPKYRFKGEFDKAEFLYNENSTRKILNKEESVLGLFLAEGYGEVWAGWMSDNKAFCSYSGAVLSDWQAREAVELVKHSGKPVILVPDFDATGLLNVSKNIQKLRSVSETLEIQVVYGVRDLKYRDHMGEEVPCKDLGDVLQHFGPEKVAEVLENTRWAAAEWQIRQILGKRNAKTGEPFHSREKQMALVAEVLSTEHSRKVSLDHMVEYLANVWDSPMEAIRTWFYSNLSEDNATSYQHLFKDILQSRVEAQEFLRDTNIIPLGFKELDDNMPGGGARPGQLAMALGKAQPLHSRIFTPDGWVTMAEMEPGRRVVDPVTGGTATVVAVHPQGHRECYRVELKDRRRCLVDLDHIWLAMIDGIECTIKTKGLRAVLARDGEALVPVSVELRDSDAGMEWVEVDRIIWENKYPAQCIELDSEHRLYITDDNIVTHNSGTGKELRMDAKLLTPTGWITMREVKVGDTLVDPATGGATTVTGVFPQGMKQMYRVSFSDGSSIEAGADHQWKVLDSNKNWRVKTTGEMRERINLKASPHFIPLTAPIEFAATERLPLDPYLVGVLLGDGCLAECTPQLTTADPEIVRYVSESLPAGVAVRPTKRPISFYLSANFGAPRDIGNECNPLTDKLRELGLWGTRAWEKSIPDAYLRAPIPDRLALLRGLMDTDGGLTGSSPACTEFCTVSRQLASDLRELVLSLGGVARIASGRSSYRRPDGRRVECRERYRVRVSMPVGVNPFRLPRKADGWRVRWNPTRRITAIEPSEVAEAQCISVDSPDKLYITDDYIVTHNTMLASQMLGNMADHGIRSIFFSLEQAAKSLFARLVSQALDVDGEEAARLIKNEDDDPEVEKLLDPVRELYKRMLIVDNVPTQSNEALAMTPSRVQAVIQEANLTHFEGESAQVVIIDHLGILQVDDDAPRDVKGSDLMAPGYIMQKLFEVCKATNVFMLVLQQLPKEVPPGKAFSYDAGRGGSKQTDFCDYILQIYRPEQAEDIDDEERMRVEGQYRVVMGKNRYGGSGVFHGIFDKSSLRIMPALTVTQPGDIHDRSVIELPEDDEEGVPPELRASSGFVADAPRVDGEVGRSPEKIEALARETDAMPEDAMELLKAFGATPEVGEADDIDPVLSAMFES